ncbi:peritrophin-1-like [Pogonomyrmex barbatus]|uniref:Peritrophin-1-like n=1 Tax=Pogonomyrmex barbatus TaxID=144034 RepID=A0A6I9W5X9_9HYME|nr:peritrophin-1-like [Pogonomyrmex barbatus]XP_011636963.1 peritrophin-1-like [Pogonomyrmex barbatus]XP_011636964.1 peritrophin-1-like [Pogonomyrmex barbatus]
MMRSLALLCLIVTSAIAAPPTLNEDSLAPACRSPKCPATIAKGDPPVNLPFPLDCLQYVVCDESGRRIVACPPDLVFNKNTGVCDTPEKAMCETCWGGGAHQRPLYIPNKH